MDKLYAKVIETYNQTQSLYMTSKICQITRTKIRKILINEGLLNSFLINKIKTLQKEGKGKKEICSILSISSSIYNENTGYSKCLYHQENRTKQALRNEKFRINEVVYRSRFERLKGEKVNGHKMF